jgi:cbb3-type cytochrome oxidase maturation protein
MGTSTRSFEKALGMTILLFLIPVALALGAIGLAAFMWSLRSGQFDDLDGAANRILVDDDRPKKSKSED